MVFVKLSMCINFMASCPFYNSLMLKLCGIETQVGISEIIIGVRIIPIILPAGKYLPINAYPLPLLSTIIKYSLLPAATVKLSRFNYFKPVRPCLYYHPRVFLFFDVPERLSAHNQRVLHSAAPKCLLSSSGGVEKP